MSTVYLACDSANVVNGACTQPYYASPGILDLSIADAQAIAIAITLVWAIALTYRILIRQIRDA